MLDINKIKEILEGIDKSETDSEFGWWETSTGADFGKKKLTELINYITSENIGISDFKNIDTEEESKLVSVRIFHEDLYKAIQLNYVDKLQDNLISALSHKMRGEIK